MQVESNKGFRPIEIKITIESEEELCDLYHRINAPQGRIEESYDHDVKHPPISFCGVLYRELRELIKSNGLMK